MKGILLIDKPSDWTSSDVVAKLRGMIGVKRIGHSGTLDPMATGLLVVFMGRATRAVEFAENHYKRYTAKLRLGITTDTEDITGNIISENEVNVSEAELLSALDKFRGGIQQIPPMYSAIKIKGQKLYNIARSGGEVERQPRNVVISSLELKGRDGDDYILDIRCSKGTYIRSLCRDIGAELGCGGCLSCLRRTEAGNYRVSDAVKIEDVQRAKDEGRLEQLLIPLDSLFSEYPSVMVNEREEGFIRRGCPPRSRLKSGTYRIYSEGGEFISLSRIKDGRLETVKSFFEV